MRRGITLALFVVLVVALASVPLAAGDSPEGSQAVSPQEVTAANHSGPPDPEADVLGWENGYWYNESIDVDRSDGLNDTELSAVVNRSMARVETVRQLEFDRTVPVEVISRQEYRERRNQDNRTTSTANRLHQNAKWEAMFSVGENENALSVIESTRTASILGFYSPAEDRIVIISENTTTPKIDEITLSQELFHALQDEKFRTSYNRSTREGRNAALGIIEGDGNLVDRLYQQRCEAEWDCLLPEESGSDSGSLDINYGVYLTQFQPYSDGPKFVRGIYNDGGWAAVNDVYENPPTSTEQVAHPEKYPEEGPQEITVGDESTEKWEIPNLGEGSVDYAQFGQAGLSAMMARPNYVSAGQSTPVVSQREFLNLTVTGEVSDFDPLNYGFAATEGWGNDRLVPYVTENSAETNETGYVWKTVWDSPEDATEFREAYYSVLEYYGGERVGVSENTWRIPDDRQFGDAFHVVTAGDMVLIVNAPTLEELGEIRTNIDLSAAMRTPSATPTEESTPTPTEASSAGTPTGEPITEGTGDETSTAEPMTEGTSDETPTTEPGTQGGDGSTETPGQPGVGMLGAVLAVLVAFLFSRRLD